MRGVEGPPDVTVVVTTHRRERLVVEAVESVRSQRGVTVEVVVVDDTREATARSAVESLGDPAVRYVSRDTPSGGLPGLVRNDAAALAHAPLVHFLDDDDRLADGALAALAAALRRSHAGMAFGRVLPFGEGPMVDEETQYFRRAADTARRIPHSRRRFAAQHLFRDSLLVNSACMVRRDAFEAACGYDAWLRCCEDVDLYVRIARQHGAVFVDRDVLHYRVGGPSIMTDVRGNHGHPSMRLAYETMGRRYRERWGALEFRGLQLLAKVAEIVS